MRAPRVAAYREPWFVVTGTGRCGTAFTARLLTCLGLPTAHQRWFRPYPLLRDPHRLPRSPWREAASRACEEVRRRRQRYEGESSWLALPRLSRYHGVVLLQVRHPLRVVSSFAASGFFSCPDASESGPWRRFAAAHCPLVGDDLLDGMRWWARWNAWAATYAAYVYRIEDLDVAGTRGLLRFLGREISEDVAHAAMAQARATERNPVPTHAKAAHLDLGWDDLPRGPELETLRETAAAFGYEPG